MNVDFKISVWERVSISDANKTQKNNIKNAIKSGEISTSQDLFDYCTENDIPCSFDGNIDETEQKLSLEENDGYSTIEIIDDGETIFTNGLTI